MACVRVAVAVVVVGCRLWSSHPGGITRRPFQCAASSVSLGVSTEFPPFRKIYEAAIFEMAPRHLCCYWYCPAGRGQKVSG